MRVFFAMLLASMMTVLGAQPSWGQTLEESFKKANTLYQNKDLAGAAEEFQKVVEILKKEKKAAEAQKIQMNVGVILFQLDKLPEAIAAYEAARALHPKPDEELKFKLLRNLASAHHKAGNYTLRAQILEDLINNTPKMDPAIKADVLAELGDSYRRSEIYTKASDAYQQAFRLLEAQQKADKELLVLTALGLCQAKLGRYAEAAASMSKALGLSSGASPSQNLAEIHSNLGIILWDQGDYSKALASVQQAQKIERDGNFKPNLSADLNNEGLIYKSVGRYAKSLEALEKSISTAQEAKDEKSEAIALGNRALIKRILGNNKEAREDYSKALAIYDKIKFQEGTANCLLGMGKLHEIEDRNFQKAFNSYQKALDIYTGLGNLGYQAEALNQVGSVLKKGIQPQRTTRDLVFADDEPVFISLKPEEATAKALEAYQKALELGKSTGRKEVIWSSLQGIGFILYSQGKLSESLDHYKAAIDLVTVMYGGQSEKNVTGDYLKGKDDLFTEAIEVASLLYKKDKLPEHLKLQMQYQETLDKEILKTATTIANLNFTSPEKNELFKAVNASYAKKHTLEDLLSERKSRSGQLREEAKKSGGKEGEARVKALEKEIASLSSELSTAEATIKNYLDNWRKQYPEDADLFNSTTQLNIDEIRKTLDPDQAVLVYFPLSNVLNILCLTKDKVEYASSDIGNRDLSALIRDDLMDKNIQKYAKNEDRTKEVSYYNDCVTVLSKLYDILLRPVESIIKDKKRLTIVPSKYIGYVPFSALVSSRNERNEPRFLVQDKMVNYIRLTYIKSLTTAKRETLGNSTSLLGIGNPHHAILAANLPSLDGAEAEIKGVEQVAKEQHFKSADILIGKAATESALKSKIASKEYNIFYFATHGVPFAEMYTMLRHYQKTPPKYATFLEYYDKAFPSKTPLNGFLYLSYDDKEKDKEDGVLKIKEIIELPASSFKAARVAVLSACNTAVTYSPRIKAKDREELESEEIARELAKQGWLPGTDQVCLVDAFMRRGFKSVIGTQWQADDLSTGFIMRTMFLGLDKMPPAKALQEAQLQYLANPDLAFAGRESNGNVMKTAKEYTNVPSHPYYWAILGAYGS